MNAYALVFHLHILPIVSLKELIDTQELSKPLHLVGYSMGGPIVGHFANTFPELTKSLSLIAPAGFMIRAARLSDRQLDLLLFGVLQEQQYRWDVVAGGDRCRVIERRAAERDLLFFVF